MLNNLTFNDKKKQLLFSELHSLLVSGLSFSYSFDLLIQNEIKEKDKRKLEKIYSRIIEGASFWKSLEDSNLFSKLDCGVIRIGEETGKLDQTLVFLNDYYKKKIAQKRMLSSTLSYPIIILLTAILVLTFMIIVVVPMFEQVYSRMGSELPLITQVIIRLSEKFPMILMGITFCIFLFIFFILFSGKKHRLKIAMSNLLLKIPIIGTLTQKHFQSQFCKLLFLLVSSNVPLLKSLDILGSIINFYPYSKSIHEISEGLKKGETFSENIGVFNNIYGKKLVALIRVGEETNSLEKILNSQAEEITSELEHELKQLGNILEPLLIIFIGIMVAFVLVSMYAPMFKLGQTFN